MSDPVRAAELLRRAIALHKGHMGGKSSPRSMKEHMDLLVSAKNALATRSTKRPEEAVGGERIDEYVRRRRMQDSPDGGYLSE